MDAEKIRKVIKAYRRQLDRLDVSKAGKDYPHGRLLWNHLLILSREQQVAAFEHCASMLPKMEQFLDEGRIEKAFRWLGFIQGVLWALGIYSLEDLKHHNRPDASEDQEMMGAS